jgi:cell division protein FtsW
MQRKPDYIFLSLAGALVLIGLVFLISASGPTAAQKFGDPWWLVRHQVLYGFIPGLLLFFVAFNLDTRRFKPLGRIALIASVALLALAFIPGLSADWSRAKSWIKLGALSFQPVELVKLGLAVFLAAWLDDLGDDIRDWQKGLLPFIAVLGVLSLLIMKQPDLGSLTVVAAEAITVLFLAGAPWLHLTGLMAAGAGLLALAVKSAPYRTKRFMTFLHPELDLQGVGYHINQAFLAIGSGGILGLGLGHSRQKHLYLPEAIGDSIFAVMAEELGFVMVAALLVLLAVFFHRALTIARRAPDRFTRLLAGGIVGWLFFQTMFNIGSMVGLMPITGLPLPFVSYGGTALAVNLAAVGILANISRHTAAQSARR